MPKPQPVLVPPPPSEPPPAKEATPESKCITGLRQVFAALKDATFRERAELREEAHRLINRYFDAKFAQTARAKDEVMNG